VPFDEFSVSLYDVEEGDRSSGPGAYDTYITSRFADRRATLVETPFSIELGTGYRVRGRIDAIYTDEDSWEVVDFKSGGRKDDPSRIVQLQSYAVAARDVDFGLPRPKEMSVTFAYLGGGLEEVTYVADDPWVQSARRSMDDLTTGIADEFFSESPGKWCRGCDFLSFCRPGQDELSG
jgi:DNA helicase-2/ATP-dependent DNA helicase PcrA